MQIARLIWTLRKVCPQALYTKPPHDVRECNKKC